MFEEFNNTVTQAAVAIGGLLFFIALLFFFLGGMAHA